MLPITLFFYRANRTMVRVEWDNFSKHSFMSLWYEEDEINHFLKHSEWKSCAFSLFRKLVIFQKVSIYFSIFLSLRLETFPCSIRCWKYTVHLYLPMHHKFCIIVYMQNIDFTQLNLKWFFGESRVSHFFLRPLQLNGLCCLL